MPDLPFDDFPFYCGIDPGSKGAFALMNAAGTTCKMWKMPIVDGELHLETLWHIFSTIRKFPRVCVGIEWPTAWPGAFSNVIRDAELFGRHKGVLESFAFLMKFEHYRILPQLWLGRLGMDGKTVAGANDRKAKLFETFYPESAKLIRGPKGGLLDGPLDALLIAHFLRTRGKGMKSIADKFGKGSPEAMAFALGGGRRKFCKGLNLASGKS